MINGRPTIENHPTPESYLAAMLAFLKKTVRGFTVKESCKRIPRLSPGLVSLCAKGHRKITPERSPLFCALMGLSGREKQQFLDWVKENNHVFTDSLAPREPSAETSAGARSRRYANPHLLSDWLHVFVKDCFQIPVVSENPELVYRILSRLAAHSRIQKSLNFLLFHGYLRRSENGTIVLSDDHVSVDVKVPSQKVRDFHRACLKIARDGIEMYSPEQRLALSLVVATTPESLPRLREMLESFGEQLQSFCETELRPSQSRCEQLHQITLSLVPVTGVKTQTTAVKKGKR